MDGPKGRFEGLVSTPGAVLLLRPGRVHRVDGFGSRVETPQPDPQSPEPVQVIFRELQFAHGENENGNMGEVLVAVGLHQAAAPIGHFELEDADCRIESLKVGGNSFSCGSPTEDH